ncbi:MAG: alpha/beta hydrolase, partial [Anaerolineales bacterium]
HGLSDPQPGRTVLDWPDDIRQLADHLGAEQFYVTGLSAGGPYALACAHQLPQRVLAAAVLDGGAPPDGLNRGEGVTFQLRLFRLAAQHFPAVLHLFRRQAYSAVNDGFDANSLLAAFPAVERQQLQTAHNLEMLLASVREGYRQGWQGVAHDDVLVHRPWGFRIEDIRVRMHIWHGEMDSVFPLQHAQYLQRRIPNCQLTVWPGQGHLAGLGHWDEVLAALASGEERRL